MSSGFETLNLHPQLKRAIDALGFKDMTPLFVTTPIAGLFACSVGCWMNIPVVFTPGFSSRIHNAIRQT